MAASSASRISATTCSGAGLPGSPSADDGMMGLSWEANTAAQGSHASRTITARERLRTGSIRTYGQRTGPASAPATRESALAGQAHAVLRDPGIDAPGDRTCTREREDRREPAEPA